MKQLQEEVKQLVQNLKIGKDVLNKISTENYYEPFIFEINVLAYLLFAKKITYDDYIAIVDKYSQRSISQNKYLHLFKLSPRTFGQSWGERHVMELFPDFVKATRRNLRQVYPSFDGEFDLWINNIRVEVKACRASDPSKDGDLTSRSYSYADAQKVNFKYHYQQLKPSCCDVFIWIGVCKDKLLYWILSSSELRNTNKLAPQHRRERSDNNPIFEGQVFMTEEELQDFKVNEEDILGTVLKKGLKS